MRKALIGFAIVAIAAGAALLAVTLSQSPTALAQETEKEFFLQPLEDVLDELVDDEVITEDQRERIADAFGERMVRFGKGGRGVPHLEIAAGVLDIEVDELAAQLRDGATIADIAGDQTQEVVDALIAEHSARIDEGVADERISEERAEELRNALAGRVEAIVNGDHKIPGPFGWGRAHGPQGFDFFKGPRGPHQFGFGGGFGLDAIAEAFGLEIDELLERITDGSSLLDIAEERGVTVQDIVDAALADIDEHLTDLVADERITLERADALRARIAESIESLLAGEFPPLGRFEFEDLPDFPDLRRRGIPFPKDFFELPGDYDGFFRFPGHHERWFPEWNDDADVDGAETSA